jgi:hypothetical protein
VDLPPLIMMGNKKQGVGFEDKVGTFWMHDASKSRLTIPTDIRRFCFLFLLGFG